MAGKMAFQKKGRRVHIDVFLEAAANSCNDMPAMIRI